MSGWRIVPAAQFRASRWRNGGGITWEIAHGRFADGPEAEWHWRFSLAEITAPGPFSAYPGIDRCLTVVSGAGIELRIDQAPPRRLGPGEDIEFPGEAAVGCELLAGPTRDLNVMVDRRVARIAPGRGAEGIEAGAGLILLYAEEEVCVTTVWGEVRVTAGDALIGSLTGQAAIAGGRAIWSRVERRAA